MNHCGIQQTSNFSSFNNGEPVVCPKPRRFHLLNTDTRKPLTFHLWYGVLDQEIYESNSCEQPLPSSPPYFCGSPPSRVSNPLIQDARFKEEKLSSVSPNSIIPPNPSSGGVASSSSSSPSYNNIRTTYNNKPSVRIEGFNCLDNNRRNCRVPALA
ncbi:hypothetical protein HanPSC8_Chr08g0314311 [Helianthus annuus]|nr:hypothetical protein HanIR_Chr08g0350361 [Helianthus annuus]KAJ0900484.1 hypothetical protein HanPSC8_Chr08g0314311 [Helianthus annuus]